MMPAKISSEMPLPIPFSVICSPNHIRKQVPAVSVRIVIATNPPLSSRTSCCPGVFCDESQVAIK